MNHPAVLGEEGRDGKHQAQPVGSGDVQHRVVVGSLVVEGHQNLGNHDAVEGGAPALRIGLHALVDRLVVQAAQLGHGRFQDVGKLQRRTVLSAVQRHHREEVQHHAVHAGVDLGGGDGKVRERNAGADAGQKSRAIGAGHRHLVVGAAILHPHRHGAPASQRVDELQVVHQLLRRDLARVAARQAREMLQGRGLHVLGKRRDQQLTAGGRIGLLAVVAREFGLGAGVELVEQVRLPVVPGVGVDRGDVGPSEHEELAQLVLVVDGSQKVTDGLVVVQVAALGDVVEQQVVAHQVSHVGDARLAPAGLLGVALHHLGADLRMVAPHALADVVKEGCQMEHLAILDLGELLLEKTQQRIFRSLQLREALQHREGVLVGGVDVVDVVLALAVDFAKIWHDEL